jgi:hypothetical protein
MSVPLISLTLGLFMVSYSAGSTAYAHDAASPDFVQEFKGTNDEVKGEKYIQ